MPDDGMLTRIMRVLSCFSADEPAVGAGEIAVRSGIPISTVHRLLADLVAEGLLARAPGRTYTIGARLWELGELSPLSLRLRETALPHMARLYEATGENVHLAVLDGVTPEASVALYVGRVTGSGSIPTLSRMGGRQPLHTTGVGKALLSTRDAVWLERYFRIPLQRETTQSIVDEQRLRSELRRAQLRGYATTREEMTLGNVSVAAPVSHVQGLPSIAIGVVVHLDRADERRLAPMVVQAARDLHHDLRSSH
ncbi:IclR family transcriptional regulator [Microbacterium horticulturae]|uniref:IclR family transcriptional regulator n=1 Tax=Microbacterium horticulturae TaxID=3028316 RepID=A0ABY8C031_9MICO|nr:IclR family transcriptional regulator [Microbacterium sp. KACC 23027]WEG08431.1 IclR family transcriptional regulator [Microbacterium sp. KACC 23027]